MDDLALVREVLQRVGDLDIEAALELITEDVLLELPFREDGGPRRMQGAEPRAFFCVLPQLFSRLAFHDVVVHGALDSGVVVAEYASAGPTRAGRDYPNRYVAFLGVRDGQVDSWREYFNPLVVSRSFASG